MKSFRSLDIICHFTQNFPYLINILIQTIPLPIHIYFISDILLNFSVNTISLSDNLEYIELLSLYSKEDYVSYLLQSSIFLENLKAILSSLYCIEYQSLCSDDFQKGLNTYSLVILMFSDLFILDKESKPAVLLLLNHILQLNLYLRITCSSYPRIKKVFWVSSVLPFSDTRKPLYTYSGIAVSTYSIIVHLYCLYFYWRVLFFVSIYIYYTSCWVKFSFYCKNIYFSFSLYFLVV